MTIPKFRAWHKKLKVMEPVLVINWECKEIFTPSTWSGDCGLLEIGWDFDEIELMQCLGQDERGNDVFEGDILVFLDDIIFSIDINQKFQSGRCDCHGWDVKNPIELSKVIGNIFEHPHLLEKLK